MLHLMEVQNICDYLFLRNVLPLEYREKKPLAKLNEPAHEIIILIT